MKYILIVTLFFMSGCMTTNDSFDHQPLGVQPFYAGTPPAQTPNITPPNNPPDFTPINQPDFIPAPPPSFINIFVE